MQDVNHSFYQRLQKESMQMEMLLKVNKLNFSPSVTQLICILLTAALPR